MTTLLASGFLFFLAFVLLLNLFSLPANWIFIALVALWRVVTPTPDGMDTLFFVFLVGLAVLGEVIEYIAQGWGAKKYGSSTGGMFAGLVGAFIGAFAGLPFFFGFGSLIGALAGAWLACYAVERMRGQEPSLALRAAWGTLMGRFLGIAIKCAIGALMFGLVFHAMCPDVSPPLPLPPNGITL